MTGLAAFVLGVVIYFLMRYRFTLISLVHDIFVLRAKKAERPKRLRGNPVMFFELEEVWPERGEEKKEAS